MSNKNYHDTSFLLEAANAEATIEPGNISSLSNVIKFLEDNLKLTSYIAKKVWDFLSALYSSVKRYNTSQYDPVFSQKLSDVMKKPITVSIFHSKNIEVYYSGKSLVISDFTVKFFNVREVAAQCIINQSFAKNSKKIMLIMEPLNFFASAYIYYLIERIQTKYGYREAIPNKYLRAIFDILISQFSMFVLTIPWAIIHRQVLKTGAINDLKKSGFVDDFISGYKKWKKLSIDVKTTELGKVLLKIESLTKQYPSEKDVLKGIIDDPEKLDIILGISQRMF